MASHDGVQPLTKTPPNFPIMEPGGKHAGKTQEELAIIQCYHHTPGTEIIIQNPIYYFLTSIRTKKIAATPSFYRLGTGVGDTNPLEQ